VPTLIADGTDDQLDPVANDHILARLIPPGKLVLYPDAGHGFLFQDNAFRFPRRLVPDRAAKLVAAGTSW
jgi:pimeloyl-ACP methyl ester carboxylesterase